MRDRLYIKQSGYPLNNPHSSKKQLEEVSLGLCPKITILALSDQKEEANFRGEGIPLRTAFQEDRFFFFFFNGVLRHGGPESPLTLD